MPLSPEIQNIPLQMQRWRNGPVDFETTALGLVLPGRHALWEFYEDFNGFTAAASGVSGWIVNQVGTGTTAAVQDENGGVIKFTTGTTANDNINYQWGNNTTVSEIIKPAVGKRIWLAGRFKTEDADKDEFHFGAHVSQTAPFATEPSDQFRFRSGATPDALQFAVGKTNSTEVTIGLGTMADNTYVRVLAFYDGYDTVQAWRFDDSGNLTNSGRVSVTSSSRGDLLPDTEMTVGFGGRTTDTGGDDFFFDYVYIAQER